MMAEARMQALVLLAMLALPYGPALAGESRPNIVVIVTDDQRWDALGAAGNTIIRTPHLDRLAAQGTRFTNAFASSSICAASRASILTGMYERRHGCNFHTGPLKPSLLAESYPVLMRGAGYFTGFVGKYGVGDGKREVEGDTLFDRWYGFYGQGQYFPKDAGGKHLDEIMIDQAEDFLDELPPDRPFCLSISFKSPHSGVGYLGYTPEKDLAELYRDVTIPYPATATEQHFAALPEFLQRSNARYNYWELRYSTPEKYQETMKDYYRLITGMDRAVGRLRGELSRRGLGENTVLVFLSDNGDMTADYLIGGKELLYDVSIRVPMMVYDPRVAAKARGQTRDELVLNIDVSPIVLDLAGVAMPPSVQGMSLAPLVRGEKIAWREDFFCENNFCVPEQYYPKIEGVRTARWKYIRYPEMEPDYEELFDLQADPLETKNLAGNGGSAKVLVELRRRCDELVKAAGAE